MNDRLRGLSKNILPDSVYRTVVRYTRNPPVDRVDFGDLRRLKPVSDVWGLDRGQPVDRYYIEKFLSKDPSQISGHVMEVGGNAYTLKYGGEKVSKSDILHVSAEFPGATIIADLRDAGHIPSDTYDAIICTQTVHLIYEIEAAITTLYRILKPGGTLFVTMPGISQISRYDMDHWGDCWRFTTASVDKLFSDGFAVRELEVKAYGNVLAAISFLHGVAADELENEELDFVDPDYQVLIAVRAVKAES